MGPSEVLRLYTHLCDAYFGSEVAVDDFANNSVDFDGCCFSDALVALLASA